MAGKIRNLVNRSGRYHARLVVPKDLRGVVGKTELRTPLGGDYREALKLLPGAVAQLQHQIAMAERKAGRAQNRPARYPLAPEQIAASHYQQRLAFDDELRNDHRYPAVGINDLYVERLREGIAGKLHDHELTELIGDQLARFRAAGNVDAKPGTDEWRIIARALCSAELEALARVVERDEGDFAGKPSNPMIANTPLPDQQLAPVNLKSLWADYVQVRKQAGYMKDGGVGQGAVIESLRKFLGHSDARRLEKKDVMAWRDHLIKSLSAKTVSDKYLSTLRSLLKWAVENDRLPENVAANVRQPKPRQVATREKGFRDAEALKILKASRAYEPHADNLWRVREKPGLVAAKQWVPLLCAFTGARVTEMTQVRKEDIRKEGGRWIIRITPDAGTVKAGGYRDVPLHAQVIEAGFVTFVEKADAGPLFHNAGKPEQFKRKATQISNQLATWLRESELSPEGVRPNHGWRHRFKTQCIELGILARTFDAIQGHAGTTASDDYGDVTIKAKCDAIDRLPCYDL